MAVRLLGVTSLVRCGGSRDEKPTYTHTAGSYKDQRGEWTFGVPLKDYLTDLIPGGSINPRTELYR